MIGIQAEFCRAILQEVLIVRLLHWKAELSQSLVKKYDVRQFARVAASQVVIKALAEFVS